MVPGAESPKPTLGITVAASGSRARPSRGAWTSSTSVKLPGVGYLLTVSAARGIGPMRRTREPLWPLSETKTGGAGGSSAGMMR